MEAPRGKEEWAVTKCWHCRSVVRVVRDQTAYWRCGVCRKCNGRPPSARGVWKGLIRCGLCRFYASRLVHAFATGLIAGIVGSGLLWALPEVSRDYSTRAKVAAWVPALALAANVLVQFALAARLDPGRVPKRSREQWARLVAGEEDDWHKFQQQLPWCDLCDNLKPPRAHHCSTCSRCVVGLDHHCVFLHNCVGAGNVAHFVAFLLSIVAGTLFVVVYVAVVVVCGIRTGTTDLRARDILRAVVASRRRGTVDAATAVLARVASTRDGRFLALGAVALGVLGGVGGLAAITLGIIARGETALERSARLYRAGPDYRHGGFGSLSGCCAGLYRRLRQPLPSDADHASAVSAKLQQDVDHAECPAPQTDVPGCLFEKKLA